MLIQKGLLGANLKSSGPYQQPKKNKNAKNMSGNPLLNDSMNQSDDPIEQADQNITIDEGEQQKEYEVEKKINLGVSKLIPFEDEPEQNSPLKQEAHADEQIVDAAITSQDIKRPLFIRQKP